MTEQDPRKNSEGYMDLTPYEAINNIEKEKIMDENKIVETPKTDIKPYVKTGKKRFNKVAHRRYKALKLMFGIANAMGFHVENRIILKDIKTGSTMD